MIRIPPPPHPKRDGIRARAKRAKQFRSRNLVCVLENPSYKNNIGGVLRNVDALGYTKLYIVDEKKWITEKVIHETTMVSFSASANLWVYVVLFPSTQACRPLGQERICLCRDVSSCQGFND
jgi:tRNA G18 (ribose-2'-O)-methylase SpoU